ncbi:putative DNA-binding transcriptional regulator YafY [Streptomyces candidus]|uniref:Putative DNA-binding transcriptional regulator YafY n=1 Tax=Streptomyces candidus TaxID=67283 RepID=A0A7X0LSI7_9ACTN|nr:putative DNA-binding transcriptional regulator YafY [Streptomyces candidus]GHH44857.1 transcriptional regulator [Streptomyces candidus]
MKSSRLLSILLILQNRGRATAADLAAELDVSVRTVYRDVDALLAAGVPLYADAGHGGGYRLHDGYRTRLTGLNADEAEALFLSGLPGPAAELGLGPALAAAQLKLRTALPAELRDQADRLSARFHLDAPGWYAPDDEVPYLPQVADAVWRGRALHVRYRRWKEPTEVGRRLEPYGLVLKAGRWYVVAASAPASGPGTPPGPAPSTDPAPSPALRTYRVDQILELSFEAQEFTVPDGFDLPAYWRHHQRDFHARLYQDEAEVRLHPRAVPRLTPAAARALAAHGVPGPDGWIRGTLPIESLDHAHGVFLALGADVEVLAPPLPARPPHRNGAHPRRPLPAGRGVRYPYRPGRRRVLTPVRRLPVP